MIFLLVLGSAIYTIVVIFLNIEAFWLVLPSYTLMGAILAYAGYLLLKENRGFEYQMAGIAILLWGLHKIDYPYLRPIEWFAPIGFMIGAIFQNASALGILIIFFERVRGDFIRSEDRFQILFDSTKDALFQVHGDIVIKTNAAFRDLTGYHKDEMLTANKLFRNLSINDIREQLNIMRTIEVELIGKQGDTLYGILSLFPVGDENNNITYYYDFVDITELKRYQDQSLLKNKLETLNIFSGGLAHEFNNLLMGISGNIELFEYISHLSNDQQSYIDEIKGIINNSKEIVRSMQQLSSNAIENEEIIDLHAIIDELVQFLNATGDKSIKKINDIPADTFYLSMSHSDFYQVLLNLGINALHALEGIINPKLHFYVKQKDLIDHNHASSRNYVHLYIEDNGVGMSEEVRQHCFDPFFTTKKSRQGTGLGLSIVYNLITNKYKGQIEVRSKIDLGTIFIICLPIIESSSSGQIHETLTEIKDFRGDECILLVEDERYNINLLSNYLEQLGYKVLTAENGDDGIEELGENINAIDLVILDLNLPKKSGIETFFEMHDKNKDLPIIISSGYMEINQGVISKSAAILSKPYNLDELGRAIRKVISSSKK